MAARDGRSCVVEYCEISTAQAEMTNGGRLVFGAGNIANHLFRLDFLRDTVIPTFDTQYHIAKKKIAHVVYPDATVRKPEEPNGIP